MKTKSVFVALICGLLSLSPALAQKRAPDPNAPTWQSESARTLDPALRAVADHFVGKVVASGRRAGMVIGIVDGKNRWVLAYGRKALGSDLPPNGDTLYEIGSVTKTFTATALALMSRGGRVKLSEPVSKYLPHGARVPSYRGRAITLEDLATHTSGLPRMPSNWVDAPDPYAAYTPADSCKFLAQCRLDRAPGRKYDYSNFGAGLLGLALSRARGSSYEKMVVEMICRPLGMKDTAITLSKDQRARLAPGYLLAKKGKDLTLTPAGNWTFQDSFAGAGALRSTVNDLMTYVAANLGVEPTPLRDALALTQKPRRKGGDEGTRIGLGWHSVTLPEPTSGVVVCHAGGTGGYNSYLAFSKQRKAGVVVLSNGTLADGTDEEDSAAGMGMLALMMHPELLKQ